MDLSFLNEIEANNFVLYFSIVFVSTAVALVIYTFIKQRNKFVVALVLALIANVFMFSVNIPDMKQERDHKIEHKKIDELIDSVSEKYKIRIKEKDAQDIIDKYENGSSISYIKIRATEIGEKEASNYFYNVEDSKLHIYKDSGDRELID